MNETATHNYTFTFDEFIKLLGIVGVPKDITIVIDDDQRDGYQQVRVRTEEYKHES